MTRAEKLFTLVAPVLAVVAFALPTAALSQETTPPPATEPEKKDGEATELESITVTGSILRRSCDTCTWSRFDSLP